MWRGAVQPNYYFISGKRIWVYEKGEISALKFSFDKAILKKYMPYY